MAKKAQPAPVAVRITALEMTTPPKQSKPLFVLDGVHGSDLSLDEMIAAAQVHAMLALVEQQRIANRIALARVAAEADRSAGHHNSAYGLIGPVGIYDKPHTTGGNAVLQDDIREGLGL